MNVHDFYRQNICSVFCVTWCKNPWFLSTLKPWATQHRDLTAASKSERCTFLLQGGPEKMNPLSIGLGKKDLLSCYLNLQENLSEKFRFCYFVKKHSKFSNMTSKTLSDINFWIRATFQKLRKNTSASEIVLIFLYK